MGSPPFRVIMARRVAEEVEVGKVRTEPSPNRQSKESIVARRRNRGRCRAYEPPKGGSGEILSYGKSTGAVQGTGCLASTATIVCLRPSGKLDWPSGRVYGSPRGSSNAVCGPTKTWRNVLPGS